MDVTQSFRLAGTTTIVDIVCDHVDGQYITYWEDIEQIYPGIKHIMNGNVTVKLLRDSQQNRIVPHRIKHYPDVVLDIVLSTSHGNGPETNSRNSTLTSVPTEDDTTIHLSNPSTTTLPQNLSFSSDLQDDLKTTLSLERQVVPLSPPLESDMEHRLVSSLPTDFQAKVLASSSIYEALVQAIQDGLVDRPNEQLVACLQGLKQEMSRNTELAIQNHALASKNHEMTSQMMTLMARLEAVVTENNALTGRVLQLQEQLEVKQDAMHQLQLQALDRLALLQQNVKALMTQTYELHEYPIPRLFLVLPVDTHSWNPLDVLANRFRLYFLCECGEHTQAMMSMTTMTTTTTTTTTTMTTNQQQQQHQHQQSRMPHTIHLAKHEGYDITRPKEFFQQYGSYVLTILRMLKFGLSVAGVAIPTLSQLVRANALDQAAGALKSLTETIEPGVNQIIDCIEKNSVDEGEPVVGLADQMDNNEALEGADLRQLETFLKNKDEKRVLGNLYRTVTAEGHVKWVCLDHYRHNYQEKSARMFRNTVETLQGVYDEHLGRVEVVLTTTLQAEQFYGALEKAKSIFELHITLDWKTTQSDFKRLRDTLAKTSVAVLALDLNYREGPASGDLLNRNRRYDPIIDIMRHPSIQSFTLLRPERQFVQRSHLAAAASRDDEFPNLKHLALALSDPCWDTAANLKALVAKAPNLSSLVLNDCQEALFLPAYIAIAEHQSYPIIIQGLKPRRKDYSFCIPPPPRESTLSLVSPHQSAAHLLKMNQGELEDMDWGIPTEAVLEAFARATEQGDGLKTLNLWVNPPLSDGCLCHLSTLVARSKLKTLDMALREDERRVQILESIPWEHLRVLNISIKDNTFLESTMKALVEGVQRWQRRWLMQQQQPVDAIPPGLEDFLLVKNLGPPLLMTRGEPLPTFLATLSLKSLQLRAIMDPEQALSLIHTVDVSRMHLLALLLPDADTTSVERILNGLQHAKALQTLILWGATISEEQMERMKAKGVTLQSK
ncbi:hypothetical protein BGX34_011588 [Mortierella sp. NVP85]|nr:hypothetical protein BGX34_011588 [Mortierella sp. NVP85]